MARILPRSIGVFSKNNARSLRAEARCPIPAQASKWNVDVRARHDAAMRYAKTSIAGLVLAHTIAAAQPSGAHPRIWLDDATLASMRAQRSIEGSGVRRAFERC